MAYQVVLADAAKDDANRIYDWVVELNRDVIVKYWDGDIEYTEDAIAAIKSIA